MPLCEEKQFCERLLPDDDQFPVKHRKEMIFHAICKSFTLYRRLYFGKRQVC